MVSGAIVSGGRIVGSRRRASRHHSRALVSGPTTSWRPCIDERPVIRSDAPVPGYAAEGVGFEPTIPLRVCWFSRPVRSTALPPLRMAIGHGTMVAWSQDSTANQCSETGSVQGPKACPEASEGSKVRLARRGTRIQGTAQCPVAGIQRAEREGFEPSVPCYRYAGLANRWFQPLTHLSKPNESGICYELEEYKFFQVRGPKSEVRPVIKRV